MRAWVCFLAGVAGCGLTEQDVARDPGADACLGRAGACASVRVLGAGKFDRSVVMLSGPGGMAMGEAGALELPTIVAVDKFEDRVAPQGVTSILLTLFAGSASVQKRAPLSFATGPHQKVELQVP